MKKRGKKKDTQQLYIQPRKRESSKPANFLEMMKHAHSKRGGAAEGC